LKLNYFLNQNDVLGNRYPLLIKV